MNTRDQPTSIVFFPIHLLTTTAYPQILFERSRGKISNVGMTEQIDVKKGVAWSGKS